VQAAEKPAVKGLEGYTVGLEDESFESSTVRSRTGHHGRRGPRHHDGSGPGRHRAVPRLEAKITAARGGAGRSRRGAQRHAADPAESWTRGRRAQDLHGIGRGRQATFDVVLAQPDGTRLAGKDVPGRSTRSSAATNGTTRTAAGATSPSRSCAAWRTDASISAPAPARISAPVEWGTYRLDVSVRDLGGRADERDSRWAGRATRPPTCRTSST
jgi:uncharacterized protein YfaS (alpha-2-macroglobulin family)